MSDSVYIVQRKTKCDRCYKGVNPSYIAESPTDGALVALRNLESWERIEVALCKYCTNGYIYEEVPLLEVLKQIYVMGEPIAGLPTKIKVLPDDAWIGDDEPSAKDQLIRGLGAGAKIGE